MAAQQIQAPQAAARMTDAAKAFVDSLNDGQKAKAIYEYMDGERVFWYYPPMNRHGLALKKIIGRTTPLADIMRPIKLVTGFSGNYTQPMG